MIGNLLGFGPGVVNSVKNVTDAAGRYVPQAVGRIIYAYDAKVISYGVEEIAQNGRIVFDNDTVLTGPSGGANIQLHNGQLATLFLNSRAQFSNSIFGY